MTCNDCIHGGVYSNGTNWSLLMYTMYVSATIVRSRSPKKKTIFLVSHTSLTEIFFVLLSGIGCISSLAYSAYVHRAVYYYNNNMYRYIAWCIIITTISIDTLSPFSVIRPEQIMIIL